LQQEIRTEILRIKGTRHYKAEAAFSVGELVPDADILLVPEPQNPHDKNAVAVLSSKRKMLGHISKDIAAKYQVLCFDNKIIQAKVHSSVISGDHAQLDIRISVTHILERQSFKHQPTASVLPGSPGTYEISLQCGPTYIGATSNLRRRYGQHLNALQNETHSNNALQADFNISGLDSFAFIVLRNTSTKAEAEDFESFEIISRLKNGKSLYNKTLDGKGTINTNSQSSNTISDVFFAKEPRAEPNKPEQITEPDPFLKSFQDKENPRLEKLARLKSYDASLIVSHTDKANVNLHEFRTTQNSISHAHEIPSVKETPSVKHFLQSFKEYKAKKKTAKSDLFLEEFREEERSRLAELAKARAQGKHVRIENFYPSVVINSDQKTKKSDWKTFESQVKSIKEPRDKNGQTALHRAAVNGDSVEILKLIDSGAHKTPKDSHGKTPWDYAKISKKLIGSTAYYVLKSRDQ
tara:strand:- start:189 stop:1586 length:1398 start_codon:yes stop_codon:yes gene_type:complete